eukprot:184715-Lingulodinium_polyedra.AAC.1
MVTEATRSVGWAKSVTTPAAEAATCTPLTSKGAYVASHSSHPWVRLSVAPPVMAMKSAMTRMAGPSLLASWMPTI